MALAVPAGAKPGKGPDKAPLAGTTCAGRVSPNLPTADGFPIDLAGKEAGACVDVSNVTPGEWVDSSGEPLPWEVTVTVTNGTLKSLLVILRDSVAPGDACGVPDYFRGNITGSETDPATLTLTLPGADGDYVNACGVEWAEKVEGEYYDDIDTTVDSPLAFLVFARGSRDLAMTLDVDLP